MLPCKLWANLVAMGEMVDLNIDDVLLKDGEQANYVYFPFTGFVSLITLVDDHPGVEMALIGKEGMLGSTLLAGISVAPLRAVVQKSGSALRIDMAVFQKELLASTKLREMVGYHLYELLAQLSSTAACASFHAVRPRLAKRLLATQDRVESDTFHFTHQSLANMLGVRRSAVSIAAGLLQKQNCIRYARGNITVVDRAALVEAACSCYEGLKAHPIPVGTAA